MGPIVFQNFVIRYIFNVNVVQVLCLFLMVFRVNGSSKLHLLFNLELVIMAFLKVLFMKGLLLYLRYFCFKGANFSRVKLKAVSKLLTESSVSDKFFIRVSSKSVLLSLATAIKEFFTFTFGKGHSTNRHYQFMVIRYSSLYSARFHKKRSHICNNMIYGRRVSTHVTSWCFDKMT